MAKAYRDAKALVEQHPENAVAHFALAYVLRYGGALEESAHECDAALSLDPGNYQFRSCLFPFEQLGNYGREMDFLQLDAGSQWASTNLTRHFLREGKLAQARDTAQRFGDANWNRMTTACIDDALSACAVNLTKEQTAKTLADPDAELHYWVAQDIAFCGQKDLALRLLKTSIAGNYCADKGLQTEPMFAKLKSAPEFTLLLSAAKQCRDDFLAETSQAAH